MTQHGISPEKVTKPIQLLAAWLIGLFVTNASFLLAAEKIQHPSWGSAMLLIAAVVNVPLFIGALFLLQTKFRPQMQEDSYYSRYLDEERRRNAAPPTLTTKDFEKEISQATNKIIESIGAAAHGKEQPIANILRDAQTELLVQKHGSTRVLAELYSSPETWERFVKRFERNGIFKREVNALISDGIATKANDELKEIRLTDLGRTVALQAEEKGSLFSQKKPGFWKRRFKDDEGEPRGREASDDEA